MHAFWELRAVIVGCARCWLGSLRCGAVFSRHAAGHRCLCTCSLLRGLRCTCSLLRGLRCFALTVVAAVGGTRCTRAAARASSLPICLSAPSGRCAATGGGRGRRRALFRPQSRVGRRAWRGAPAARLDAAARVPPVCSLRPRWPSPRARGPAAAAGSRLRATRGWPLPALRLSWRPWRSGERTEAARRAETAAELQNSSVLRAEMQQVSLSSRSPCAVRSFVCQTETTRT